MEVYTCEVLLYCKATLDAVVLRASCLAATSSVTRFAQHKQYGVLLPKCSSILAHMGNHVCSLLLYQLNNHTALCVVMKQLRRDPSNAQVALTAGPD